MNEEQNGNEHKTPDMELFPLDEAAIEAIAEIDQQEKNCSVARNAILSYFLRVHRMSGNWQLAPNRRELIKVEGAIPIPLPVKES